MPYPGVPKHLTAKMERCVARVMASGKNKSSAIGICHSSIVGKDHMSKNKYKKIRKPEEAEERGIALGLVGIEKQAEEPPEQVIEPESEVAPAEEKSYDDVPLPTFGATSFSELADAREAYEKSEQVSELTGDLHRLIDNIMWNSEITDKAAAVKSVVDEYTVLVAKPEKKSFLNRVVDFVKEKLNPPKIEKKDFSPFLIYKDAKGNFRYVAVVTNNYQDRDQDIITEEAHKEFMEFLDKNPDNAPELWIWHTPGTAHKSRADFWAYENGFVIYSGILTKEEAEAAERAKSGKEIGMSHGLNVLSRGQSPKLITQYRTFEISYLPLERASNPWTAWSIIQKEVEQMNEDKKKFLVQTLGAEVTEALIADTAKAKAVLDALGVESKETDVSQSQPQATPSIDEIVKAVSDKLGMEKLSELLVGVDATLTELKADNTNTKATLERLTKTDDEKIAEAVQVTPATQYMWLTKAMSQAEKTVVDETKPEDKTLIENTPTPSWVSQAIK